VLFEPGGKAQCALIASAWIDDITLQGRFNGKQYRWTLEEDKELCSSSRPRDSVCVTAGIIFMSEYGLRMQINMIVSVDNGRLYSQAS
jgi:hypothetical protein